MILLKAEDIALQFWLLLALWISLISFHMFKLSLPFVSMTTVPHKTFFQVIPLFISFFEETRGLSAHRI